MADDHRDVYEALLKVHDEGIQAVLATVISTLGSMPRHVGAKMLVYSDRTFVGTVGGGALESRVIDAAIQVLQTSEARTETYTLNNLEDGDPGICGGTAQIFIEPVALRPTLLVIGGGHVGKALAELGKWAGFRVILSDDRAEFCSPDYLPGLEGYLICPPAEIPDRIAIHRDTYIAAVTRGLPVDLNLMPVLLKTPAAYIGVIGSRRRWALTVKALREKHGLSEDVLARVRAPIGLEIEAETPKEIAISILAEIIMVRRGGTGEPMKWIGRVPDVQS